MSRLAAVVGWGKSGQGAAGALLARDWQVRAFDARGGQSLFFDDVADVEVCVQEDPNALVDAIVEAALTTEPLRYSTLGSEETVNGEPSFK